jgi:hypothetical protein
MLPCTHVVSPDNCVSNRSVMYLTIPVTVLTLLFAHSNGVMSCVSHGIYVLWTGPVLVLKRGANLIMFLFVHSLGENIDVGSRRGTKEAPPSLVGINNCREWRAERNIMPRDALWVAVPIKSGRYRENQ